jgi:hypothetical protein
MNDISISYHFSKREDLFSAVRNKKEEKSFKVPNAWALTGEALVSLRFSDATPERMEIIGRALQH